jgi:hypothetical protein
LGGAPVIAGRRSSRTWMSGIERSNAAVYGFAGFAYTSRAGPISIIWPAYITAMRSAVPTATARLCVISTIDISVSATIDRNSSSTWAWTVTSSDEVGSSASRTSGSSAIAIATITRCAMPPES